ncbi:sugar transporter [Colletotrichum asianum]
MGLLQKIVRNEATKSDPPEIYNARVVLISLVACGGALLFGMDMGIIGGVLTMDSFKKEYGLMDQPKAVLASLEGNVVSVIQAGAFAGALLSMWLANRVGRRFSLIIASILVFIGVALQAAASGHIEAMYVGRLVAGVAIGIASSVNPLYVSENAPRGIRGLLTGLYQLSIVTGLTINYGSLLHIKGHSQYIIPLSLQTFPAVILLVGMLLANESPRFLAQRHPDKALAVLAKLRNLPADHPYIVQEMDGISRQLEEERALAGLALFYVGFYIRFDPPVTGESVSAPGYVALVAIYIFAAFGWGPVVWTYSSEIPPARLRALMMGMATASQWLFNFVVAKASPSMFATLGTNGFGTYFVYGTFCFIMVVFAFFFVPETAGVALEQMDELFEKDSLRDKLLFRKGPPLSSREDAADEGVLDKKNAEHVEVA